MNRRGEIEVLAIMPALEGSFGGVQAAGAEAWQAILEQVGESRARAIYYETGASKLSAALNTFRLRERADIVLVWHLQLLKLFPFLGRAPRRAVVFLHGVECWRRLDALTLRLLKRVDLVLSNSDHTWQRFLVWNPECDRIPHETVQLGLNSPLLSAVPTPSETPVVLMVGRVLKTEDYKGHREVIEAWAKVRERCPRSELWIVGGGDLRPKLEALAKDRGVAESVRFFGEIPDALRDDLLDRCRCVALPSRGEGFGLVYLEAMRKGRPCLVSTVDAGREVVAPPEAGLAVDPDDRQELATALGRLLTQGREWDQWSVQARDRYERHYTGRHFRTRLLTALFGETVNKHDAAQDVSFASDPA